MTKFKNAVTAWKAWKWFWTARDIGHEDGMIDAIKSYRTAGHNINGHTVDVLLEALADWRCR